MEDGSLLDFLYPQKTQAVISQLSSWTAKRWAGRGGRFDATGATRQFTQIATKGKRRSSIGSSTDLWTEDLAEKRSSNSTHSLSPPQALEVLNQHIEAFKTGEYRALRSETWQMYLLVSEDAKTPSLLHDLMDIFSDSTRAVDGRRYLRIFDALPTTEYTLSSTLKAILVLVEEENIGKAVLIHDMALESFTISDRFTATDLLLMYALGHRQWQLIFHLWTSRLRYNIKNQTSDASAKWSKAFFTKACQMPQFDSLVLELLRWLRTMPIVLFNADPGISKFLKQLTLRLFRDTSTLATVTRTEVLNIARGLDLSTPNMYEEACLVLLKNGTVSEFEKTHRAMQVYNAFSADIRFSPRKVLLQELLTASIEINDSNMVSTLSLDWQRFHGPYSRPIAVQVMKFYASRGSPETVETLLKEHVDSGQKMDVGLIYPLLHAHAALADPVSVNAKIDWMRTAHNIGSNAVCLNILMDAYVKSDDMDGALNTLTLFPKNGLRPDHYTFGTIMPLLASRGDVETTTQLLNVATSLGVPNTPVMKDARILAHLNNEDPQGAEALAEKYVTNATDGRFTRMWTQIIAHWAVRKNFDETIRVSKRMQALKVPFDGLTYAAIMRVFVATKRTHLARVALDRIKAVGKTRPQAIHYAIIMDGFAGEFRFEDAFRAHAEMLASGIVPTLSTQIALLRVHTLAAKHKFTFDQARHPGVRLDISEETLQEFITGYDPSIRTDKEPQLRSASSPARTALHAAYFELLLASYGSGRSYDAVKMLLTKCESFRSQTNASSRTPSVELPMKLLESVIKVHYRQSAFGEVEKYWGLAKATAAKLAQIPGKVKKVPVVRRFVLARVLDTYMKALYAQQAIDEIRQVVDELLALGFGLDNGNWNTYIQLLAESGRHSEAFSTCERNVMADFPGWFYKEDKARKWAYTGAKSRGLEYLGGRLTFLAPTQLQATYKTMIRLAKSLRGLREQAPFDRHYATQLNTIIQDAPRTYGAVRSLPTVNHPSATHVLGAASIDGEKRSLPERVIA